MQKPYIFIDKYKKDNINYCKIPNKNNNQTYELSEDKLLHEIKTGMEIDNVNVVNRKGKTFISNIIKKA